MCRHPDGVYQPLPTPAYSVDVILGMDSGPGTAICDDIDAVYIQQVNKASTGEFLGSFQPIMKNAVQIGGATKSMCPHSTNSGLGCTPALYSKDAVEYSSIWKEACKKAKSDQNSDASGNQWFQETFVSDRRQTFKAVSVPLDDLIENVVDPNTGFVRHTILIVRSAGKYLNDGSKVPLLRVTLKSAKYQVGTTSYTKDMEHSKPWGMFTPISTPWIASYVYDSTFGAKMLTYPAGSTETMEFTSLPDDYKHRKLHVLYPLILTFFLIPITISLYYAVTEMHVFGNFPYLVIGLLVRLPLAMVGLTTGSLVYFFACIFQTIGYFQKTSVFDSSGKRREKTYWNFYNGSDKPAFAKSPVNVAETVFWLCTVVATILYIVHSVYWMNLLGYTREKVAFSLFENQKLQEIAPAAFFYVENRLLTNFFLFFMATDSIYSSVMCGMHSVIFILNSMGAFN